MKSIVAAAGLFFVLSAFASGPASAHEATACIRETAAAAAKVGAVSEPDDNSILVMHPSAAVLKPLLDQMMRCIARVLPEHKDAPHRDGFDPQYYWFRTDIKQYCRTTNAVGTLGGNSPHKNDHSFFLVCG